MKKTNGTRKSSKLIRDKQENSKYFISRRASDQSFKNRYMKSELTKGKNNFLKGYSRYILEKPSQTVTPNPKYIEKIIGNPSPNMPRGKNKKFLVGEYSVWKIRNTPLIKREISYTDASEIKRYPYYFDSNHRDTLDRYSTEELVTQKPNYLYGKYLNTSSKSQANSVNNLAKKTTHSLNNELDQNHRGITRDTHWVNQIKISKGLKKKIIEGNNNRNQDQIEIYRFSLDRKRLGISFSSKFMD